MGGPFLFPNLLKIKVSRFFSPNVATIGRQFLSI